MPAKKKDKEYSRAEGAALLRKQLAERKGKKVGLPSKENVKNLGALAATVATIVGPGKVVKGAKIAKNVIRGKKTYYHGSPKEIAEGATLRSNRAKGASATNKKKLAKEYASKKLILTSEGVKKSPTGGNVYKVKSKSGKVTQTGKFGKAKEFNASDFIVIKKVK
jgi:hypothetical protein